MPALPLHPPAPRLAATPGDLAKPFTAWDRTGILLVLCDHVRLFPHVEHWEAHVPPGQMGLLFCSEVRVLKVGVNAVDLVQVPLPCLHLQFHREHPFAFALPIFRLSLMEVPVVMRVDRGQCSPASAFPQAERSLQNLLPDLWAHSELRRQMAEPGALSGARQHGKNVGISQGRSCGRRSRAGRWVVCLLEALLCEVRLFQEP